MKKFLLSLSLCFMCHGCRSTDLHRNLSVWINGNKTEQGKKDIQVEQIDQPHLSLSFYPNFVHGRRTLKPRRHHSSMKMVTVKFLYGGDSIATKQNITILPGDKEGTQPSDWMGPMLGEVPIDLKGLMTKDQLSAKIDIDFAALGMMIKVAIGDSVLALPEAPQEVKKYTENLSVTINDTKTDQGKKEIQVEMMADGTCNFILPNFIMADATSEVPVGTIRLNNVTMTQVAMGDSIATKQNITILPGDKEGTQPSDWMGPMLGEVPIDLKGLMTKDQLSAKIDIDFAALGMMIKVANGDSVLALPEAPQEVKKYTENLSVTINDTKTDQGKKEIQVEIMADGTCNFILPNFIMADATSEVPVAPFVSTTLR